MLTGLQVQRLEVAGEDDSYQDDGWLNVEDILAVGIMVLEEVEPGLWAQVKDITLESVENDFAKTTDGQALLAFIRTICLISCNEYDSPDDLYVDVDATYGHMWDALEAK